MSLSAKLLIEAISGSGAIQHVYKLEPGGPLPEHVLVSAVNAFGCGDETYIFECDKDGRVLNWLELEGSFKGSKDHHQALRNAGYEPEPS